MTLERRTPLRRSAWTPTRTTLKRRKRMKPVSDKRAAAKPERDEIREAVFKRDGYRCQMVRFDPAHKCRGHLTVHHRRKSGASGAYTMENLVSLCVLANVMLEDAPLLGDAYPWLVIREGDDEWESLGIRAQP